jgi:hypothetical protein
MHSLKKSRYKFCNGILYIRIPALTGINFNLVLEKLLVMNKEQLPLSHVVFPVAF